MDIRQLRYFLAIVEEGSFSRAATRVNVAQPALSLHVRKMEDAFGTPLLLRGPQGVTPTEAGDLLARRARTILANLEQTDEEIRSLGREPSGTVRIGLPGTISGILSVPLIARSLELYPGIKIIIAEAMSGFVREWLHEGRIELAVLYSELRETGIHSEMLLEEELVMLLPPDFGAADKVRLEALARTSLILPSGAHGLRTMVDRHMRANGIDCEPAIEVDSYGSIKSLVASGYGCSILPYHAVASDAAAGRIIVTRLDEPQLWRSAYLAHPSHRPMTRAAGAVSVLLKEVVDELIADGSWAGARRKREGPTGLLPESRIVQNRSFPR